MPVVMRKQVEVVMVMIPAMRESAPGKQGQREGAAQDGFHRQNSKFPTRSAAVGVSSAFGPERGVTPIVPQSAGGHARWPAPVEDDLARF